MTKGINIPELRFPEFSDPWNSAKLNEVCEINPSNKPIPDKFIYIDLESVSKGELLRENEIFKKNAPSRAQRVLEVNDILFQMVRPYQKNNLFFNKSGNYVASTGYAQIRAKINPKFIFHYLHFQKFVDKVIERCTGTSYPSINSMDLSKIIINYPLSITHSSNEQQKIASFFTAIDEKLSRLKQQKALLEQYKKGVMQKIFSQELRFKIPNQVGELVEPPEWEVKKLGEVGEIITGKTPSTLNLDLWNGKIQFVTPTDIGSNKYQFVTQRTIKHTTKILPPQSIMFTCIASIGKMSLSVFPCVTNQQINSIIPFKEFNNEFLFYALLNIVDYIKSTQSSNTLPIINKTEFSKFKISVPVISEQTQIANFLSSLDAKISSVAEALEATEKWKKGLLQRMFC